MKFLTKAGVFEHGFGQTLVPAGPGCCHHSGECMDVHSCVFLIQLWLFYNLRTNSSKEYIRKSVPVREITWRYSWLRGN